MPTRTALAAVVLAAAVLGAAAGWVVEPCLRFNGTVVIEDEDGRPVETVPADATACGYCDDTLSHPMVLQWDEKYLVLLISNDFSRFSLDEIQFFDGQWSYFTELSGIRGDIGGEVSCIFSLAKGMKYKPTLSDHGCPSVSGEAIANASARARAAPGHPRRGLGREGEGEASAPGRSLRISGLSLQYSDAIARPWIVSGCRMEADGSLALVMGLSGGITALALLGAAAAAVIMS